MTDTRPRAPGAEADLATVRTAFRTAIIAIAAFSGVSNILMLTGSLYMLEVYDRVLPSRSVPTLVGLSILAAVLLTFQGALDLVRSRVLVRIGAALDERLGGQVIRAVIRLPLLSGARSDGLQPLRDLDNVRAFVSGNGPAAFFDLPWMPLYIGICFTFHVMIGVTALGGALVLIALTLLTEAMSRRPMTEAATAGVARTRLAEAGRRDAEMLTAMGMAERLERRWLAANADYMKAQSVASDVSGGLGAIVRVLRMMLQSAVLGVGAYLVIRQEASPGIIIASSILAGRALAPVDLAIANWKGFIAARLSWQRLGKLFAALPPAGEAVVLPAPRQQLAVEAATVVPPGGNRAVVQDVAFTLRAGSALGVIGPSASGKSSLARALVGVWRLARGAVRLDGAELGQWSDLGRHVGYLPQDVELIDGTVADNIARWDPDATDEAVIAAATAAGVHDMIVGLPKGYQTPVGDNGALLSAGQQQRIALARALYGNPFLVVLDEPNSNLDSEGEAALTRAILDVRGRGGIAVVVAHRPSALAGVDLVLVLAQGRQQAFGPKDEVLAKVTRRDTAPVPLRQADGEGGKR